MFIFESAQHLLSFCFFSKDTYCLSVFQLLHRLLTRSDTSSGDS